MINETDWINATRNSYGDDPREFKDEIEHYCKTCGMEEVEERGGECDECWETMCKCGINKKLENYEMCKGCLS